MAEPNAGCGLLAPSWPGLSRPSTPSARPQDVDARRKAGHDAGLSGHPRLRHGRKTWMPGARPGMTRVGGRYPLWVTRLVMAGLVPAIHVFGMASKTWMPGTRPGMTRVGGRYPLWVTRLVMAGLVPAIHVFGTASKTWMPGARPGMTRVTAAVNAARRSRPDGLGMGPSACYAPSPTQKRALIRAGQPPPQSGDLHPQPA
jgi:hypothetical protein